MRLWLPLSIALAMSAVAAAQSTSTQKPAPKPPTSVTLTGCVGGGKNVGDPFTLTSDDGTFAYKLSGKNMRQYLGRRVTIIGNNDTRRLKIIGGLYPSPNVAGQAGALNGAQTAIASDPLSTAAKGDQQLPEFRVKAVQTSGASCK